MKLLEGRIASLQRRSNSLLQEINQWIGYADPKQPLEKNLSQLQALEVFMSQVINRLNDDFSLLRSLYQATPANIEAVLGQLLTVESAIMKADTMWSYFRSKLEQRFIPQFADPLFVTDIISHDCYRSVINRANVLGIQHDLGLRDYPLTYLLAEFSPMTWRRSAPIRELSYRMLPVPVIGVPWNHIVNPWELLSLHHEVAHDIDADLNSPSVELGSILRETLVAEGHSSDNACTWQGWIKEIFADFLGTLLAGPSFISYLAGILMLPEEIIRNFSPDTPHPISYLRTLLNAAFIYALPGAASMRGYVDLLVVQWKSIYGEPGSSIAPFTDDFELVIKTILATKLEALKDRWGKPHALSELIVFNDSDFARQAVASQYFSTGTDFTGDIPLRHIIGAAYMAIEEHIGVSQQLDERFATAVSSRLRSAIKERSPQGQLALRTRRSTQYLQELADAYYQSALHQARESNDQEIQ